MIAPDAIVSIIQSQIPDAQVTVTDKTGMSDHFIIEVQSAAFQDLPLMDRHRQVMAALNPAMQSGQLHAAEIKTQVRAEIV